MAGPRSATAVLLDAEKTRGRHRLPTRLTPFPTGFEPLDAILGGGVRAQDLVLVGGRPGIGKTIAMLQWARHIAQTGRHAVYACYEHPRTRWGRASCAWSIGEQARPEDIPTLDKLRALVQEVVLGARDLRDLIETLPSPPTRTRCSTATRTAWSCSAQPATPTSPRWARSQHRARRQWRARCWWSTICRRCRSTSRARKPNGSNGSPRG